MEWLQALLGAGQVLLGAEVGKLQGQVQAEQTLFQRKQEEQKRQDEWERFRMQFGLEREKIDLMKKELDEKIKEGERRYDLGKQDLRLKWQDFVFKASGQATEEAAKIAIDVLANTNDMQQAMAAAEAYLKNRFAMITDWEGKPVEFSREFMQPMLEGVRNRVIEERLRTTNITDLDQLMEAGRVWFGSDEEFLKFLRQRAIDPNALVAVNYNRKVMQDLETRLKALEIDAKQIEISSGVEKLIADRINLTKGWNSMSVQRRMEVLRKMTEPYKQFFNFPSEQHYERWLAGFANQANWNEVEVDLKRQLTMAELAVRRQGIAAELEIARMNNQTRWLLGTAEGNQTPVSPSLRVLTDPRAAGALNFSLSGTTAINRTPNQTLRNQLAAIDWALSNHLSTIDPNQIPNQNIRNLIERASRGSALSYYDNLHSFAQRRATNQPLGQNEWNRFVEQNRDNRAAYIAAVALGKMANGIDPEKAFADAIKEAENRERGVFNLNPAPSNQRRGNQGGR